jgi:hypothetical protein
MFRKALLLACTTVLALGVTARADVFTSQVTITQSAVGPLQTAGGGVIQISSSAQDQSHDVSYTVNTNKANPGAGTIYATGVIVLTGYAQNVAPFGGILSTGIPAVTPHNFEFVFALQGHAIPAVPGAALSAQFDKGTFQIIDVGASFPANFNANNPASWYPAGFTSVYKATLGPQVATGIGDGSGVGGVAPGSMNNQASFVPGGNQTPGQVLLQQLLNPNTFVTPPENIFGFQTKIQETNNATIGAITGDNAALDAAFQNAFDANNPGFGSTTPFTTFAFAPDGTGSNGDTVQTIAIQLYPVTSSSSTVVVPEPASMLVWAGIAVGLGLYRVRRSRRKKGA